MSAAHAHTRGLGTTTSVQAGPAAPTPLTAAAVLGLQGYRAYPSVSLLLTTTPGDRLDSEGQTILDGLAREARRRLLTIDDAATRDLARALDTLVARIDGPVDRALGVFASAVHTARFDLAAILVMLAIDLIAHRRAHVIGVREAFLKLGLALVLICRAPPRRCPTPSPSPATSAGARSVFIEPRRRAGAERRGAGSARR